MEIVLKGVLSGIVLAFLIGPVFFTIVQTSVERGFWSGAFVAIGVSISDSLYIALCYLGLSQLFDSNRVQLYLGYAGGLILFAFGGYYLFIKSRKLIQYNPSRIPERSVLRLIAKGFIINGLSPLVLLFWIGTVGVATTEFGYTTTQEIALYFTAIVVTVLATDLIKAKLADKLRSVLTPGIIRVMNIVLGVVMVIFGGRLIFFADQLHI
jgi:threonine/homoserine/homoserine lactone efflux protein